MERGYRRLKECFNPAPEPQYVRPPAPNTHPPTNRQRTRARQCARCARTATPLTSSRSSACAGNRKPSEGGRTVKSGCLDPSGCLEPCGVVPRRLQFPQSCSSRSINLRPCARCARTSQRRCRGAWLWFRARVRDGEGERVSETEGVMCNAFDFIPEQRLCR